MQRELSGMSRHTRISDPSSNQDSEWPDTRLPRDRHIFLFSFADLRPFSSLEPLFVPTSSSFPANTLVFKSLVKLPVTHGLFCIESIDIMTHRMFRFSGFRGDVLLTSIL